MYKIRTFLACYWKKNFLNHCLKLSKSQHRRRHRCHYVSFASEDNRHWKGRPSTRACQEDRIIWRRSRSRRRPHETKSYTLPNLYNVTTPPKTYENRKQNSRVNFISLKNKETKLQSLKSSQKCPNCSNFVSPFGNLKYVSVVLSWNGKKSVVMVLNHYNNEVQLES